jgi:hypothetical protein
MADQYGRMPAAGGGKRYLSFQHNVAIAYSRYCEVMVLFSLIGLYRIIPSGCRPSAGCIGMRSWFRLDTYSSISPKW